MTPVIAELKKFSNGFEMSEQDKTRTKRRDSYIVYNDKLKNGTRSIKVCGWKLGQYLAAAKHLHKLGYKVIVKDVSSPSSRSEARLHCSSEPVA